MPGQYNTLREIREAVIYRADLEGISDRHPNTPLVFEINSAWRDLRVKLANAGVLHVLSNTGLLTLPTIEAVTGAGYAEIDWPTDAVSVHGLDVKVDGYWYTVGQGDMTQRRLGPIQAPGTGGDYRYSERGLTMWIPRSLPTTSTSTPVAGKIMLFPVPQSGQYLLWYLPNWVDVVTDTDIFPGQEGWITWVIWETACRALIRDIGPQTSAQLEHCIAERERAWAEIRTSAQRIATDGPIQPLNRYGASARGGGFRLLP